jgi:hypothetical protein
MDKLVEYYIILKKEKKGLEIIFLVIYQLIFQL